MKINNETSEDGATGGTLYFLLLVSHHYRWVVFMNLLKFSIVEASRLNSVKAISRSAEL